MANNNYENKILYGFSDIKVNNEPILGGKSVQVNLDIQTVKASNKTRDFRWSTVTGASGQITLLSLTSEEMELLFGYEVNNTSNGQEIIVTDSFANKEVELSFARKKPNGKYIKYYMTVIFNPASIEANTLEGSISEDNITLDFEVIKKNGVYYKQIENI